MNLNTVKVEDIFYRWKDDEDEVIYAGKIAVGSKDDLDEIFNGIEDGDPVYTTFDLGIFYYINSDDERIEDLYDIDFPCEFVLVKLDN
jgi:hypothetical protein